MFILNKPRSITVPEIFPRIEQIQILCNNLNIGCFYLKNSSSRQYFQLLKKVQNPPREIKTISVLFNNNLVLEIDDKHDCSLNLLEEFYTDCPLFFQKNQHKFVCYPPQILLAWEANFCQRYSQGKLCT